MKLFLNLAIAIAMSGLAGCGGGDNGGSAESDGSSSDSPSVSVSEVSVPVGQTAEQRLSKALFSGDVSGLESVDINTLLDRAIAEAKNQKADQTQMLSSIYGDGSDVKDVSLTIGTSTSSIGIQASTTASSFIIANNGNSLAAVAKYGNGRGMAYGADVLQWMSATTEQQQHYPLFLRSFKWLMTGSGSGTLPATIKYATSDYTATSVKNFITRAGAVPEAVACAVADSANTCWTNVDVIIFGRNVVANSELKAQVEKYLKAGKSVIYMHSGWGESAGGSQVLAAMGMKLGGYGGNFWQGIDGRSVSASRTIGESIAKADKLGSLITSLQLLKSENPAVNLTTDTSSTTPFSTMLTELSALNSAGVNIFADDSRYQLHRLLVLWADMQRPSIQYGTISRSNTSAFLKTYASDTFQWYKRSTTTAAASGQGDYMPASAQLLTPNSDWEEINVTIPQASGVTLIGRGAIPGKGVQIEIVDAAGVGALGVQTSHLRSWGNPLTDSGDKYARPMRPQSFSVSLGSGTNNFVSPNGGPLMLNYSGATADTVVKLRIKGAVKYSHFDYTQTVNENDISEAAAALTAGTYGWQTTKVVGGEIQQITKYAKSVIGNLKPEVYANTYIRDGLFMSNHITNGYNDAGMTTEVASLCNTLGWTCDGIVHKEPVVQHFVGWIATCGFLCSGNPIDGSAGIGPGWGFAHEMGHNTVQRTMRIVPDGTHGCATECDNNILASATALRLWETLGVESSSGHPLDNPGAYAAIVANRATGLTGDARIADMEKRVWSGANTNQNIMRTLHFQLAFQFTKYRSNLTKPSMVNTLNYLSLLTKGDRLVAKTFTPATATMYGMGRYTADTVKTVTNHDLLYMLSSKIIGRDMRNIFAMYGVPLSTAALGSISDLGLDVAPYSFYALPKDKHNQLAIGQWVDLNSSTPAWPY